MGFVVARDGARDQDFFEYLRLLRKRKVEIADAPRALDPFTGTRWLYVWEARDKATEFASALIASLDQLTWEVVETDAAGVGPLTPLAFMMIPYGGDVSFGVHTLSRHILRVVHPDSVPCVTYAKLREGDWEDFRKRRGGVPELIRLLAPNLTGLTLAQLDAHGYVVIDERSRQTLLTVPPGNAAQEGDSRSGGGVGEPSLAGG